MDQATAQTHLDTWLAADTALATAKSYTIGNRTLTRADLAEVRDHVAYWQRVVDTFASHSAGVKNPGIKVAKWS